MRNYPLMTFGLGQYSYGVDCNSPVLLIEKLSVPHLVGEILPVGEADKPLIAIGFTDVESVNRFIEQLNKLKAIHFPIG